MKAFFTDKRVLVIGVFSAIAVLTLHPPIEKARGQNDVTQEALPTDSVEFYNALNINSILNEKQAQLALYQKEIKVMNRIADYNEKISFNEFETYSKQGVKTVETFPVLPEKKMPDLEKLELINEQ